MPDLADTIADMGCEIWNTFLDLDTERRDGEPIERSADSMTACMHFAGDWEGAIVLDCEKSTARSWAGQMLGVPPESLDSEAINDALGEMANILAGHVKPELEGANQLSLPTVVEGTDYSVYISHSKTVAQVCLGANGQRFWISLVRRLKEKNGAAQGR